METIAQHIHDIVQQLFDQDVTVRLERPDQKFGDYATNVAMQLAKPLGKNPREVAEQIAEALHGDEHFSEVTIAGPGFINLRLSDTTLLTLAERPIEKILEGQRFVVEYSCPNAFKELHTGHLYQTIFGDVLCKILEASGAHVDRTSFGGDVGLHVAKCLWGMVHTLGGEFPEKLSEIATSPFERAHWISQCYVTGAGAYEEDETAKQAIDELNKTVYGFHESDDHTSPLAQMYWTTRQWSYDYFEAFYHTINVDTMHYYPESTTAPVGLAVVKEQLAKGNLKESEGAVVYEGDPEKHLHTRVFITSKGLPTYETKDIGVIWMERRDYDFTRRILLTGNDQKEYMRVVFDAAEIFDPTLAGKMRHITNGTVRFADGKKMSSRLGNVSRAIDVVEIVREKVRELVADPALVDDVALGAIKYVFAKYRLGGDINFDIEETVSLTGNSGPYLQYAHARAASILAKATNAPSVQADFDENERLLVAKLGEFSEVVATSAADRMSHGICNYLYELAQEFNRFYEKAPIIGHEREASRLGLVTLYKQTLAAGLGLLGIVAPEKM